MGNFGKAADDNEETVACAKMKDDRSLAISTSLNADERSIVFSHRIRVRRVRSSDSRRVEEEIHQENQREEDQKSKRFSYDGISTQLFKTI